MVRFIASWREQRAAELHTLKTTEPTRVLALFRSALGLGESNQLPKDYGFGRMIENILDHEERSRRIDPPHDTPSA